jgi:8-oxo-dGTP pyrophosphatase MutT (NUDIX family)
MYKIYINDTPLFLIEEAQLKNWHSADDRHMVARYPGKAKWIMAYVDMLEKSDRFDSVTLYSKNQEQLWQDFRSLFDLIEAAGGLVVNPQMEILFILRKRYWDLPKGKIDEGESVNSAAVREVMEETGLQEVDIVFPLPTTYHTYRLKKRRILKKTYWFAMTAPEQRLIPQTEEDIEQAIWMDLETFQSQPRKIYGNIQDLLNHWEENNKLKK